MITPSLKYFELDLEKELEAECHFPHANDVTIAIVLLVQHKRLTFSEARMLYKLWIAKKLPNKYLYLSGNAKKIRKEYYNQYYSKKKISSQQSFNPETYIKELKDLILGGKQL